MSTPERVRNYVFSVNNRITYSSLQQVWREYAYGMKNFLVATLGYTVKYSCDGTTGPSSGSDHTDRWTSATAAGTRGANTSTAQSWIVLTDGDGVDFMMSYTGSTDDVGRFAYSIGGLYTPAGTATFPATATDEHQTSGASTSWIESTTSQDRVFSIMGTADKKSWRAFIVRAGKVTGSYFGVETYNSSLVVPASQSPIKVIVNQQPSNLVTASFFSSNHFFARVTMASVGTNVSLQPAMEMPNPASPNALDGINVEMQGAIGGVCRSISAWATSGTVRGKLGNMIDWWHSADARADGALTSDRKWIQINGSTTTTVGGVLWPWDGSSETQMS